MQICGYFVPYSSLPVNRRMGSFLGFANNFSTFSTFGLADFTERNACTAFCTGLLMLESKYKILSIAFADIFLLQPSRHRIKSEKTTSHMSMREQTLHRCSHRSESDNETLPHPLHNFQTTLSFLFQFESIESLQILQRNLSVSLYTVLSSGKTFPQLRKSHFQIKTVLQPVSTLSAEPYLPPGHRNSKELPDIQEKQSSAE